MYKYENTMYIGCSYSYVHEKGRILYEYMYIYWYICAIRTLFALFQAGVKMLWP